VSLNETNSFITGQGWNSIFSLLNCIYFNKGKRDINEKIIASKLINYAIKRYVITLGRVKLV